MGAFADAVSKVDGFLWGLPLIIILVGTHVFLTFRTGFIQRYIFKGIRLSITKDTELDGESGEISGFGALTSALSATIGTGNIVGVATAIISGGPGAVFWMWIIGVFGIASKYCESLMSLRYRVRTKDGRMLGGAMYALQRGLHAKWLAVLFVLFAAFAAFGIGCMTQANSIAGAFNANYGVPTWVIGIIVAAATAAVIIGGVKSIAKVAEKLVPLMAIFYIVGCLIILVMNGAYVGKALAVIVKSAFSPQAGFGGAAGFAVSQALRFGAARGLFSNESGMGSAPIVAAAAQTRNPVRQALISMTGTFWDTVVICLITGLTLVSTVLKYPALSNSMNDKAVLTYSVFSYIPVIGKPLLVIALSLFAYTTILGWSYYGERAAEYLAGPKIMKIYKTLFVMFVFIGCVSKLEVVWNLADIMNGLMVIPNVIGMIFLSGELKRLGDKYLPDLDQFGDTDAPVIEDLEASKDLTD
ncbi:MAG: sodium:alanine symporter family protein [Eubacteriales bacterium]|nr:sodium:alanine symporter family protein [Eubacteriales bacterium]